MHIPSSMLHGAVCPVTATISAIGLTATAALAAQACKKPSAAHFGAVTAFIFAAQMVNFPVQNGTSGHLLGGVLATALLGLPFGVLSLALVLAVQSLVFSDGGITTLGANVLNMSLIGAGLGGLIAQFLKSPSRNVSKLPALALASWVSVVLASLACSAELALGGAATFAKAAPAMLGSHVLIGLGEALITAAAFLVFSRFEETNANTVPQKAWPVLTAAALIGLLLSPFASSYPDGLEWVAARYHFLHQSAPSFVAPLANYTVPGIAHPFVSTGLAGLIGTGICFLAAWVLCLSLRVRVGNAR